MPEMSQTSRPLDGCVVLDFSQYVAGPLATMLLGDLGARVIKIERPGGDAYRAYAPESAGMSRHFAGLNRGKESVVCDLATKEGRELCEALVRRCDAVVHNFLPERAARFGLDGPAVAELNPGAVLCTVSSFGTDGPDAGRPAFDLVAQALSGLLALTVSAAEPVPHRVGGLPLADLTTGLLSALAVVTGLFQARTNPAAQAPEVEVSLLGASFALQVQQLARSAVGPGHDARTAGPGGSLCEPAGELGDPEALDPYYRCYPCAEGFLAVACLDRPQRERFLEVLGLSDPLVANPQQPSASPKDRAERLGRVAEVASMLAGDPARTWSARLRSSGVPAAEVNSLEAGADSRQAVANGLAARLDQPGIGPMRTLGGVVKVNGAPLFSHRPAPSLGEHQSVVEDWLAMT